jgi:hypothetical protein
LKAVRINGLDVTDSPLTFGSRAESLQDVEIVLTRQVSTLTGRLTDPRGQAATGYVVAFSTNRDRWGLASRYVRLTRSQPDGSFTLAGLPADDYHVVAVDRLLEGIGEWQDPAFLESMAASALRVSVPDGQQLTISPKYVTR